MEVSEFQKLVENKDWQTLEAIKDKTLMKIVCKKCSNTSYSVGLPGEDSKCLVCSQGFSSIINCGQCGKSYRPGKSQKCSCVVLSPLSSISWTVDKKVQAKRDEVAKQPRSDGSGILMKRVREFNKMKQERAERIDKNLEIIAKALAEKEKNNEVIQ